MKPVKHSVYYAVLLLLPALGCSSVRMVRPLEKGQSAVTVSIGGPVTNVAGNNIPLPMLSAGYNYGICAKLDIEGGLNLTSTLFGLFHLDAGVNWRPLRPEKALPGITLSPKLFAITNFKAGGHRLYPTLTPTLYWDVNRHYVYTGIENWFEPHSERSDGNDQKHHWLIAPYIGYGYAWKKWNFQIEGRGYTPNLKNTSRAVKNIGFGEYGILGFFIGVGRTIGGGK